MANVWYCQPMLADIARTFHSSPQHVGLVATATQVGYALGMPLFLPLGDLTERRRLVTLLFLSVGCSMLVAALSPSLSVLVLASFFIGLTTIIAQILIPAATELAPTAAQGQVVGKIMTGVLLGILLARTVSGFVSQHLGWRPMFGIAAVIAFLFAAVLRWRLPPIPVSAKTNYRQLLGSVSTLIRHHPELGQISLIAAMFLGGFSAFWTALVFLLETPPYHYGSQAAGLFGLVGAAGAMVAPVAGHLSDRRGSGYVVRLSIVGMFLGFALFWSQGFHLWGLIVGVVIMDAAVQAAQVSNQSAVFSLRPEARSRMNTVYMLCYFVGASLGSYVGAWAWSRWQWPGVCAIGILFTLVAALIASIGRPYRLSSRNH